MKYTMLLASSFSGSTLLSMLMASHPKVVGFGDTYAQDGHCYDDSLCTCNARIAECPFRKELEGRMRGYGIENYTWLHARPTPFVNVLKPFSYGRKGLLTVGIMPDFMKGIVFRRFYRENDAFLKSLSEMGCEHYFDGSKNLVRLKLLLSFLDNVKVVHLIRDPRGFVSSSLHKHNDGRGYREIMRNWMIYNNVANSFRNTVGKENYELVSYEELVEEPEKTLTRLYLFMGLEKGNRDITQVDSDAIHVVGNRMRTGFDKIEDKSKEWEGLLDGEVVDYVTGEASKMPWYKLRV